MDGPRSDESDADRRDTSDPPDAPATIGDDRAGWSRDDRRGSSGDRVAWGDGDTDPATVLVVDDEPGAADLAATYLERILDGVETVTATAPEDALESLCERRVDCVVSDYDMPGMNGLELLRDVRSVAGDVPFVLFTGKGSEEIASEAISAGVTDYLQKGTGTDQYAVLANRVENALLRRRAEARSRARGETIGRYETVLATLRDPVFTLDGRGRIAYVNRALCRLTGAPASDLRDSDPATLFEGPPPTALRSAAGEGDGREPGTHDGREPGAHESHEPVGFDVLVRTADGGVVECESRVSRVRGGEDVLACVLRDVSDRVDVETELTEINRKVTAIHEFASTVSTATTVAAVFEHVVDAAERILEFDRCITARREGDYVYPAALSRDVTSSEVRRFEVGEAIAGRTVAERRTFVIDDFHDEHSADANAADPVADDLRSAISVPIGEHGVFQAVSSRIGEFDGTDVEFAELIASHAGDAIEQILTETDLRTERDRLAALFDNVPVPIARVAIDPDGEKTLDATNEAFESTFGFAADEEPHATLVDELIPEDGRRLRPGPAAEVGEPTQWEVRRVTTDGARDFLLNVIPTERSDGVLVYAVYADIGEQKRIERTLRGLHETTREMFLAEDREAVAWVATRAAIDTLGFPSSGVRLYDQAAGTLQPTAISREATAVIGDRPAFGPGDGVIWDAFGTEEPALVDDLDGIDTAVEYGDLRSLLVVPLDDHGVMPFGSTEPDFFDDTDVQLARVLAANVAVALDRAERTEQLQERDAALEREVDRLEKFAGVVSHDLRNPLNVAMGRLDLARERVDDADVRADLDRVVDAHDRMSRLIDDLLALARQGRTVNDREPVALAAAATEAWRTVETGTAELDARDPDASVEADPERLRTLFENLFRNAVEHAATDADPAVRVTVGPLDGEAGFYVADDGPGFDVDPERAMEYGVSGRDDGTGFGLAIVREVAAAHGWTVTVDGDDGARFEFLTAD